MKKLNVSILFSLCASATLNTQANGIYGNGVGARARAMGGADVAWANDPLGAMGANPAGLGQITVPELDLGGVAGMPTGHFTKAGSGGDLDQTPGGLPEGALGLPVGKWPVTLGLSFVPESLMLANWHYVDPVGGLGGTTSYGYQQDKSEILVLRSALGAGVELNSRLSLGASVGLIYNENWLKTPYIFQNLQPGAGGPNNTAYNGAKTLLDLHTSGFGVNAQVGLLFAATTNLQFGVSYQSETRVNTDGDASGNPYQQFGASTDQLAFHYSAGVQNIFPQEVSLGASWKFHPQWRLALQLDWVDWANAFHTLPVSLSNGSNGTVDAVLGASFKDLVPLNWQDEFVYRVGLEYAVTGNLTVRAGYCYGNSPVPDGTLTPMTAAIMEHTVTAGVGYHWSRYSVDLAYQYDLPATQNVGTSSLLSGEYSQSSVEVSDHILTLTTSVKF